MNLLLDSAFKATLILAAAYAASLALRRASADVRHLIWLMATLAVAMIPLVLSIPQSSLPSVALITVPAIVSAQQAAHKLPGLTNLSLIVWAAGAILMTIRLLAGILSAARITRSAKNINGLLYSGQASTPMTWGFLRPVVILPSYAIEWSAEERDLVLCHERAHIARHDWLWQTLASVITAVFWFHPLMWIANLQLRREAEAAVDDCVLSNGVEASHYASRLVDVARHLKTTHQPLGVIPMIRKPELETRVRSILDPSRRRAAAGWLVRSAIALAAIALILPVAVTRQKVYAQGKTYKVGDDIKAPSVLHKVEPGYTEEARSAKIEGSVVLTLVVQQDGQPNNIQVKRSLDPGLDAKAIEAVSQWRFNPGTKNGKPVPVYANIEVTFRLL